jgi:hypothetical protein
MADNAVQGMFVANRSVTIETSKGYVYKFKKDVPMYVAPLVREEMLKYGVLPVEGELPVTTEAEKPAEPIGQARLEAIDLAIRAVCAKNDPKDFTGAGVPREDAMVREAGFRMARREINKAFLKWKSSQTPQEE